MQQAIYVFALIWSVSTALPLSSTDLLETSVLPSNLNFMPSISNGHLGYAVFGSDIFMNGVYNGGNGDSHRARIPNWMNVTVSSVQLGQKVLKPTKKTVYALNLRDGYFGWKQNFDSVSLEQRIYAHRYFNRALIYELVVRRSKTKEPLKLTLIQTPGEASQDFVFEDVKSPDGLKLLKGTTMTVENQIFQKKRTQIFVALSEDLASTKQLILPIGEKELHYRFVMVVDQKKAVTLKEMNDVLALSPNDILVSHAYQWNQFWEQFSITIIGNSDLSKTINAAIFYLANSLPSLRSNQPLNDFYGLSPSGLAFGNFLENYQGHSFWDTEIWMLPSAMQICTTWSEALLRYRIQHLNGAIFNSNATGYQGARFPWESAFTGTEVTNACCPDGPEFQIHITPDIAFAIQQQYEVTNDEVWLCQEARPTVQEIAEFLESRVVFNPQDRQFHLENVMGPDEDHPNITDSVYTNVVSKMALEFAVFTEQLCAPENPHSSVAKWKNIANKMFILYDPELDYHPEYVGYKQGEIVKQADVVLLGYPLQYEMNSSTRLNDIYAYENVTRANGPAMTWSMFAINSLDIGEVEQAKGYFQRSYQAYVEKTWRVWSEAKLGEPGAYNFITGVGGFLQAIINGYGGVRFYREKTTSVMELRPVNVLPGTRGFDIHGLKFGGARFRLHIQSKGVAELECTDIGNKPLKLVRDGRESPMTAGLKVIYTNTVQIKSS